MLKKKRWIWNLGSECWLGSILAKGSFRSAGGLSNNEHAKRRQRNGRSICTHLKFIQKSLMIALITIFFSFMRITIVKECSPYCAKVIFSKREAAMQLSIYTIRFTISWFFSTCPFLLTVKVGLHRCSRCGMWRGPRLQRWWMSTWLG